MVAYSLNADIASWSLPDVAASIASNAIVAAATDRVFPAGMRGADVESGRKAFTHTVVGRKEYDNNGTQWANGSRGYGCWGYERS